MGRGPIAGPVNACAVSFCGNPEILNKLLDLNVTDSKKLTDKKRKHILEQLKIDIKDIKIGEVYANNKLGTPFKFCVEECSHQEIDSINILQASLLAMKKASERLITQNTIVLIDGNKVFSSKAYVESVIKGDSKSIAIGLASIIAKVFRDEKMSSLDLKYPGYNLSKHAGYPTKEHKLAVQKLGPSPIHRKTFKGVKEYL